MNAAQLLGDRRPLATIARPAAGRRVFRGVAVAVAGGEWLTLASARVRAELEVAVGPARCSPVTVSSHPPGKFAVEALEEIGHALDPVVLQGAHLALQASAADATTPWLWVFVAECDVLWPQSRKGLGLS